MWTGADINKISTEVPQKSKNKLLYDATVEFFGIYLQQSRSRHYKNYLFVYGNTICHRQIMNLVYESWHRLLNKKQEMAMNKVLFIVKN